MKVIIRVFSSGSPYCSGCVDILRLADEIERNYGERVEIVRFVGEEVASKLKEFGLGCVPAMIIGDGVIFDGLCPSFSTVQEALKETGLCG